MDELIRAKMHEALDVEKPDGALRSRVLGSLPVAERSTDRFGTPSFHWAGGFVAGLLAVAVVASFLYARGALSLHGVIGPMPSPGPISAVNGTCQPRDVP